MKDISKNLSDLESRMTQIEDTLSAIKDNLKRLAGESNIGQCTIDGGYEIKELTIAEKKVKDIMDNFDFEKVHDVMKFLNWKWISRDGSHIPTVEEIKKEAHRLLTDAIEEKTIISTGGFRAVYETIGPEDNDPYIGLEFIIEDMEGIVED